MAPHLIDPRPSLWEQVKGFSPQVKQGLIAAAVALVIAIGGCDNLRLRGKIHDLEQELAPFRNLAVQEFRSADTASLKKLADMMGGLRDDYKKSITTTDELREQINKLKEDNKNIERNLYSKMTQETIQVTDTNRVVKYRSTNGSWRVFIRLKSVPIKGSIQGTIESQVSINESTIRSVDDVFHNWLIQSYNGVDFMSDDSSAFVIRYVADSRATNTIERVRFVNENLFNADGKLVPITWGGKPK